VLYVVIDTHSPEFCPMSNGNTKALMLEMAPQVPKIAEQAGAKIVADPYVRREYAVVTIVEADGAKGLDRFIVESSLAKWNTVRVLPSLPIEQAINELRSSNPIL
jgi:uncharacterized protein with GYD domain